MTTKATYAVVSWRLQGEEPLNPEEVEVCLLSDLIVKTCSKPGGVVQLQFKQVLWEGTILSVHGKKKEAEKALRQAESPKQTPSVPDEGRQRKKKSFGDDFVSEEVSTEASKGKEPASKSAAGKRAPGKSAADKSEAAKIAADKAEKQKERERKRKERELHRNVLSEQNTLLLARMTDADQAVEVDESDNFDSSLVPDCMEILNPDANPSPIVQLQRNHYAQASPPPQPHTSQSLTPLQPSEQHNASTNITPLQATYMQRQPLQTIHNPNPTSTPSRPQFGGKCPRRRQFEIQQDSDQRESGCPDCKRLKQEVQNLKMQLSAYQEHNDQGLPKPGKVLPAIANQFKMIELSPGSGIYVFDKHIEQACARKTPTSCAAFLLNCFFTNTEMAGMNLTGANGKPHPDKQVIESILAFTMKKHPNTSAAVIKASLRNKIAANNSRANKVINH